jgi:hypothetical protein
MHCAPAAKLQADDPDLNDTADIVLLLLFTKVRVGRSSSPVASGRIQQGTIYFVL